MCQGSVHESSIPVLAPPGAPRGWSKLACPQSTPESSAAYLPAGNFRSVSSGVLDSPSAASYMRGGGPRGVELPKKLLPRLLTDDAEGSGASTEIVDQSLPGKRQFISVLPFRTQTSTSLRCMNRRSSIAFAASRSPHPRAHRARSLARRRTTAAMRKPTKLAFLESTDFSVTFLEDQSGFGHHGASRRGATRASERRAGRHLVCTTWIRPEGRAHHCARQNRRRKRHPEDIGVLRSLPHCVRRHPRSR